jgi:pimeloyl-ACP methyl ester carboxylesterase
VFQPRVPLPVLGRLRAPCLIIAGDHDVIVPQHTLAIYQHLPYAWLWIVPNSGHATLVEHSADFNQQTDAFFRAPASAFRTP